MKKEEEQSAFIDRAAIVHRVTFFFTGDPAHIEVQYLPSSRKTRYHLLIRFLSMARVQLTCVEVFEQSSTEESTVPQKYITHYAKEE